MIGKLKGTVEETDEETVIIDVHGVGYLVHCSQRTLSRLPARGEAATLLIDTWVREDMIRLYGFASGEERDWFRLLVTVQGVGARVAQALLSVMEPGALASAVALKDVAMLSKAPGVGKRLAERIATELKDKVPAFATALPGLAAGSERLAARPAGAGAEAVSALVNLGYAQVQAAAAVSIAVGLLGEDAETGALIRQGLKELAR